MNTAFFHHHVNHRRLHNRILSVTTEGGEIITEPLAVRNHIVSHFQQLLSGDSATLQVQAPDLNGFIGKTLDENQRLFLAQPVTDEEIRTTLFSLAKGKAPSPDGYNVEFFKLTWGITGPLILKAVKNFFETGRLLKEINNTILTLVPKNPNASSMNDFRPIACCNTLYKCISKILTRRIAHILPSIIGPTQTAFVKGRRISDNILIAQELFAGFHHVPYLPKCAIKVDFQKAYDTINWSFIQNVLSAFKFPESFSKLVLTCISTAKFSVAINGDLHGFFASTRGIRQGDPLSPYLFVLAMEVFSGLLRLKIDNSDFQWYWRCKKASISHLFFADDVLIFARAHLRSVKLIKKAIDLFSNWSGLKPNARKSNVYLSGGNSEIHRGILLCLGFQQGSLPFRYLGVPVISSRLRKEDCKCLIDSITSRVRSWTRRFLSFAGRLQLIQSVLLSIQVYWATIFSLPKSVLYGIEIILKQFLWKGPDLGTGGAKVAWDSVCLPKEEGGLGIRRLTEYNRAMILKHIWLLFTDKESHVV